MLVSVCVVCEKCDHHLLLDKLKEHLASNCRTYTSPASSPDSDYRPRVHDVIRIANAEFYSTKYSNAYKAQLHSQYRLS